jgi:hypothetical protein
VKRIMRFAKKRYIIVMFLVLFGLTSTLWAASQENPNSSREQADHIHLSKQGFMQTKGHQLFLDGKPYYGIGFNKFDLFQQILAESFPNAFSNWGQGYRLDAAEKALKELNEMNFDIIRVNMSPFFTSQWRNTYFNPNQRDAYYQAMDQTLDLLDKYDIKVVFTLNWNIHNFIRLTNDSVLDFFTNENSESRILHREYVEDIVNRYKDRTTIAMWEIGNEYNLITDHNPNHPNSAELGEFYKQITDLIKSIDSNHIVTTGDSQPRPAQYHLYQSRLKGEPNDWTQDSFEQRQMMLELVNGAADVISIHYYGTVTNINPESIEGYAEMARNIRKPLFLGETGPRVGQGPGAIWGYRHDQAVELTQDILDRVVDARVPLTLFWSYHFDGGSGINLWDIRQGIDDEILEMIMEANCQLKVGGRADCKKAIKSK